MIFRGSPSIGRFIFIMEMLFLVLVVILSYSLITNLTRQFETSNMLMEYTGAWNEIFVSLIDIGNSLDQISSVDAEEPMAVYEAASDALDASIYAYIGHYADNDDAGNVFRRLLAFNEYQRRIMEHNADAAELYRDRLFVGTGIERHTEEILRLYRDQMGIALKAFSAAEEQSRRMTMLTFSMIAIVSVIISAIYLWFGVTIRRMIDRAVSNMDMISQGAWDVPNLQNGRFDEFRELFIGINRLKHRLAIYFQQIQSKAELEKKLLDEKLKNETARRLLISSEMDMLRSQVNPHFLFNSLSQIGLAVLVNDAPKVLDMVECTGRILRYSLYNKERLVPLSDELSIVETYVRLFKMSNDKEVDFRIICHGTADGCLIVPMCIQPIVENALKYGFGKDRKALSVSVTAVRESGMMKVTVLDDGVGIEDPQKALNVQKKGIGLMNIRRRLELQYGREGLVRVMSRAGEYTRVELMFPEEGADESADR